MTATDEATKATLSFTASTEEKTTGVGPEVMKAPAHLLVAAATFATEDATKDAKCNAKGDLQLAHA